MGLFLRLDVLSLAFIYRRFSYETYDISEFGIKDCLTTTCLGWKNFTFSSQDEAIYTYSYQYTRHFITEKCYGGRTAAYIQDFRSSTHARILENLPEHLKSNSRDICNLRQEYKKYIKNFNEKNGIEYDKMTKANENYRLANEKKVI